MSSSSDKVYRIQTNVAVAAAVASADPVDSVDSIGTVIAKQKTVRQSYLQTRHIVDTIYEGVGAGADEKSSWKNIIELPVPLENSALVTFADSVYIIGGNTSSPDYVKMGQQNVYRYTISSGELKECKAFPYPIYRHAAIVVNGMIYVTGGLRQYCLLNAYYSAWVYNPSTDEWTKLADLPEAVFGHKMIVSTTDEKKILIVKGYENPENFQEGKTQEYDIVNDSWTIIGG